MHAWLRLKEVLEQEIVIHRKLLEAIRGMRNCLLDRDLDGIQSQIKVQALCKEQIQELEKKRAGICQELEKMYGLPGGSGISQIILAAPEDFQRLFSDLKEKFLVLLEEIKIESRVMRYVLRTVVHYIDDIIEIYTSANSICYTSKGEKHKVPNSLYVASA